MWGLLGITKEKRLLRRHWCWIFSISNHWEHSVLKLGAMEHYSKGRNEEEELNSANIPLTGIPQGYGWMLITGRTRFHFWITSKTTFIMDWYHHFKTLIIQITDCTWSSLQPSQRRRHSRWKKQMLKPWIDSILEFSLTHFLTPVQDVALKTAFLSHLAHFWPSFPILVTICT